MRRRYLFLAFTWFVGVLGVEQTPLLAGHSGSQLIISESGEWNLLDAQRPAKNTSYNLVFDSVSSLLQRWPNTRYRNGHTLVPGIIPTGTVLHHGGLTPGMPEHPDWVATDPEHSYIFASTGWCFGWSRRPPHFEGDPPHNSSCWHLSMAAARPLKVLYFDGSSAAKLPLTAPEGHPLFGVGGGTLDTQDILTWGEVREDKVFAEAERIRILCENWGPNGTQVSEGEGFDGFVRMEMDFEVMICDFEASLELVSAHKPATAVRDPLNRDRLEASFATTGVIEAGSWHNGAPGETRIVLELPRLISFFDHGLFPILAEQRVSEERWEHRVRGLLKEERDNLPDIIREKMGAAPSTSGVDWKAIFQVVTDRYAERLEILQGILTGFDDTTSEQDIILIGKKAQSLMRVMLAPYIPISFTPSENATITLNEASPAFQLCSTVNTKHLIKRSGLYTPSERLMLEAIQVTNKEICRVVTKAWAQGVMLGLDAISGPEEPAEIDKIKEILAEWKEESTDLVKWLDWSVWLKCKPACGLEEMCYLPTWPHLSREIFRPIPTPRKIARDDEMRLYERRVLHIMESLLQQDSKDEPDWFDPQPSCIRRVTPYELGW